MRIGALLGPVAPGAGPSALVDQVKTYAECGFASLWTAHTVGRGFFTPDPVEVMIIAATHTSNVEIGTAILQESWAGL